MRRCADVWTAARAFTSGHKAILGPSHAYFRFAAWIALLQLLTSVGLCAEIPAAASDGWQRLQTVEKKKIRGTYTYFRRATVAGVESEPQKSVVEFSRTDRGTLLRRHGEGAAVRVTAANPDYAFDASQSESGGVFQLGELQRGPTQRRLETAIRDTWEPIVGAAYEILGKTLTDLVASEPFTMTSLQVDDATNTATIEFDYSKSEATDTAMRGGTIVFSTARDWAIKEYVCNTPWGRVEGVVDIRDFAGTYVPSRVERRMHGGANDSVVTETYALEDLEELPADKDIPVRLEDYGLEPARPMPTEAPRASRWVVATVNVLLILVIGVLYLWARNRGQRSRE